MSDRRSTPANARVAAMSLKGQIDAPMFVEGWARQVTVPVADLLHAPAGRLDRQFLMGDVVAVYEEREGYAFVQAKKDGYVGYLDSSVLGEPLKVTHWVAVPRGHIYSEPDIKSPVLGALLFGNRVEIASHQIGFHELAAGGYIPKPHLWPLEKLFNDPVTVAQLHFGVPYLWGGNSTQGIHCSGLVQTGLWACGCDCPGDSDQQESALGVALNDPASLRRGDLVFWRRHVGWMVDEDTLIHANAHHMAVAYEPLERAVNRIEATGDGPITSMRRI